MGKRKTQGNSSSEDPPSEHSGNREHSVSKRKSHSKLLVGSSKDSDIADKTTLKQVYSESSPLAEVVHEKSNIRLDASSKFHFVQTASTFKGTDTATFEKNISDKLDKFCTTKPLENKNEKIQTKLPETVCEPLNEESDNLEHGHRSSSSSASKKNLFLKFQNQDHSCDNIPSNLNTTLPLKQTESMVNTQIIESRKKPGAMGLPREWEMTQLGHSLGKTAPMHGLVFTTMSYNVLSQDLLERHDYLYSSSANKALDWDYRRQLLMNEILMHNPDIVCLQEVEDVHFKDFFSPNFTAAGYQCHYIKRTNDKTDGCAIMFKTAKFTLIKEIPISFNRGGFLARDNVALILQLSPNKECYNGRVPQICVATTHLLFNPKRGDIKLAQLMMLLAELDRCADVSQLLSPTTGSEPKQKIYCPTILCGDFNLEPRSQLFNFLVNGYLQYVNALSNELSGQLEGLQANIHRPIPIDFLPSNWDISDQCQYIDLPDSSQARPQGQILNSKSASQVNVSVSESALSCSQTTGWVQHWFNFVSVYEFSVRRLHGAREVTTQHNAANCTVDYIFYNVLGKQTFMHNGYLKVGNVEEGVISLLGRYGLMSSREVAKMGNLPNATLPSDHLCLIAEFLLRQ